MIVGAALLLAACAPQPWNAPPPEGPALPAWTPPPPPPPPVSEAERASLRALSAELCPAEPGDAAVLSATAHKWLHWPGCRIISLDTLNRELALLQRLLDQTAQDDPARPQLLHRIADGHFTREERSYRSCMNADVAASATAADVAKRKAEIVEWKSEVVKAQREGFRWCARLQREHPEYRSEQPCPTAPGAAKEL